jgi:aminoglycoside phosphotransferase (APT) family kinase protein
MAEDIVFLLASLHSHFLDKSQLVCHEAGLPRFSRQFPVMWKVGNIERYTRESLVASGGRIPSRLMKRVDDIWPATVASLELHRGDELTIIHSDVHIGNWYKTNTNAMGLADWQFVVIGHWARDLSYALATALVPEDRRNWERDLVKLYIDKLSVRSGKNFKFQQAWLYYRQQMLSALAMWTGVLRHDDTLPDMQPEDMSLAMIERIAAAIDDLDVIDSIVI